MALFHAFENYHNDLVAKLKRIEITTQTIQLIRLRKGN
jgi:hypothetical protein